VESASRRQLPRREIIIDYDSLMKISTTQRLSYLKVANITITVIMNEASVASARWWDLLLQHRRDAPSESFRVVL
jgi:hypothetical protein